MVSYYHFFGFLAIDQLTGPRELDITWSTGYRFVGQPTTVHKTQIITKSRLEVPPESHYGDHNIFISQSYETNTDTGPYDSAGEMIGLVTGFIINSRLSRIDDLWSLIGCDVGDLGGPEQEAWSREIRRRLAREGERR